MIIPKYLVGVQLRGLKVPRRHLGNSELLQLTPVVLSQFPITFLLGVSHEMSFFQQNSHQRLDSLNLYIVSYTSDQFDKSCLSEFFLVVIHKIYRFVDNIGRN